MFSIHYRVINSLIIYHIIYFILQSLIKITRAEIDDLILFIFIID